MTKQLNKKGTSLVELIAVIVIMGIIAGIAIPTTIAVINRQKRNAALKSAQAVFDAAKSALLEASTGESISYVDAEDGGYKTTSTALANASEIEKDPSDTDCVMTIHYVLGTSTDPAYYYASFTDDYTINGIGIAWDSTKKELKLA